MQLMLCNNLILVCITVINRDDVVDVPNVVVDTGSATTVLSADILASIDVVPQPNDVLYTVRGIGGGEVVFARKVTAVRVDGVSIPDFEIEIGGMDYGMPINGILGMDFLLASEAVINLHMLTIEFNYSQ